MDTFVARRMSDAPHDVKSRSMNGAQRVLIVGSFAPSLIHFRGAFIRTLIECGHTVVAAAPDINPETMASLASMGAEAADVPLHNASLNPFSLLRSLRALRDLIRRTRPDVVIGYGIKPVIVCALAGHAERVEMLVSVITGLGYPFTEGHEPKRMLSRAAASILYRIALNYSHSIVVLNPDDEAFLRRQRLLPSDKPAHLLNGEGLDIDYYSPAPLPNHPSFLMIARLLKGKGIREFARAAKQLKAAYPEVPIVLVGYRDPSPDSLSQADLDELIRCGVIYKGHLADVRPAIAECSVYVLPSYREGTPRSVLEAMSMGRAIITTDVAGCRETVRHGENGLLIPARNADALYEGMVRFMENPDLARAMGAVSRSIVERKYNVVKVNAELLRFCGLADYGQRTGTEESRGRASMERQADFPRNGPAFPT